MATVWDTILALTPEWATKGDEASGTTLVDFSGNARNGTIDAGVTLGASKIVPNAPGTAWDLNAFEGGTVPAGSWMGASTFTGVVFFRLTAFDTDGSVLLARSDVGTGNAKANKAWAIIVTPTGAVQGRAYNEAGVTVNLGSSNSVIELNRLYMLTVWYDGTNLRFYVAGGQYSVINSIASSALAGPPVTYASNSKPITIGRSDNTSGSSAIYTVTGKIQGAAFWSSALSVANLDAIWASARSTFYTQTIQADAPLVHMRAGESSGNSITDISGNARGNMTLSGTYTRNAAALLSTDASPSTDFATAYASMAHASWMDVTNMTVEAWVNADTYGAGNRTIVQIDEDSSPTSETMFRLRVSNGKAVFIFRTAAGITTLTGATTLSTATTYHLSATYDGTDAKIYVNGVLDGSVTVSSVLQAGTANLFLGSLGTFNSDRFDGRIQDVAMYATALSALALKNHYDAGATGSQTRELGTAPVETDTARALTRTGQLTLALGRASEADEARSLTVLTGYPQAVIADRPLAYYRMGEVAGTTLVDSSGHSHDGTYGASIGLGATGLLALDSNKAADFTAANYASSASVPNATWMQPVVFSIEAIIEPDTITGSRVIAAREDWNTGFGSSWSWILMQNGSILTCNVFVGNGSTFTAVDSPSGALVAGQKHYVTLTYDGAMVRLYLNGTQVGAAARTGDLSPSNQDLWIGRGTYSGDGIYDGRIDEVAFYDYALTLDQIHSHYFASLQPNPPGPWVDEVTADVPIAWYRLDEASGTVMLDSSGAGRHGVYVGSPGLGAPSLLVADPDTAVDFDGSNYGSVPWDTDMTGLTTFTIEAWVKPDSVSGPAMIAGRSNLGSGSGSNYQMILYRNGAVWSFLCYTNNQGTQVLTDGGSAQIGTAQHLVGTFDGVKQQFYVDGVLVAQAVQNGTLGDGSTNPFVVGATAYPGQRFDGVIDEVLLYDYAIGPGRVIQHFQSSGTAPSNSTTITLGRVEETDAARALTVFTGSQVVALGQASETDEARLLGIAGAVAQVVGRASESDEARTLATAGSVALTLGRVEEVDEAQALMLATPPREIALGQASEVDELSPMGIALSLTTVVDAVDVAMPLTVVRGTVTTSLGRVVETEVAFSLTPDYSFQGALGRAEEESAAAPLTTGLSLVLGLAQGETVEVALPLSVSAPFAAELARVGEGEEAFALTTALSLAKEIGAVLEVDVAVAVGLAVQLARVGEVSEAFEVTVARYIPRVRIWYGGEEKEVELLGVMMNGRVIPAHVEYWAGGRLIPFEREIVT